MSPGDNEIDLSRITIVHKLTADHTAISVDAVDAVGEPLALLEALGMLEFARLHLIAPAILHSDEPPPRKPDSAPESS